MGGQTRLEASLEVVTRELFTKVPWVLCFC
jgi:hypothetical protein